jgi:hypothetical protein
MMKPEGRNWDFWPAKGVTILEVGPAALDRSAQLMPWEAKDMCPYRALSRLKL